MDPSSERGLDRPPRRDDAAPPCGSGSEDEGHNRLHCRAHGGLHQQRAIYQGDLRMLRRSGGLVRALAQRVHAGAHRRNFRQRRGTAVVVLRERGRKATS